MNKLLLLWQLLRSDKKKQLVLGILATVLGLLLLGGIVVGSLLLGMVYLINPQLGGDIASNPHYMAIQSVRQQYDISNDFDLSYLIMIDLLHDHKLMRQSSEVASFLDSYFVIEHEETREIEPENEEDPPEEETITYYLFAEGAELMQTLFAPPFHFTDEELDTIRHMIYSLPYQPGEETDSGELEFNGSYPMPLKGSITSGYGPRTHPVTGEKDFHTGIDIQGTWHGNIVSIADGRVVQASRDQWYGYYILIRHEENGREFYSFYAHLSQQKVRVGQSVRQGQVIALEGGQPGIDPYPGLSTGHHLHFGIYANPNRNSHLDPTEFLYR